VSKLRYLSIGLAGILIFVGMKMLASGWYEVPTAASLGVIILILATAAAASVYADRRESA
jgi:predicted tellurium resistance membrane protein TerC